MLNVFRRGKREPGDTLYLVTKSPPCLKEWHNKLKIIPLNLLNFWIRTFKLESNHLFGNLFNFEMTLCRKLGIGQFFSSLPRYFCHSIQFFCKFPSCSSFLLFSLKKSTPSAQSSLVQKILILHQIQIHHLDLGQCTRNPLPAVTTTRPR